MEATLQKIFGTTSFEEVSDERLAELTVAYPYFPVLQYLLSIRMQHKQDPGFDQQYQKTLLYFHNPLWAKEQMKGWKSVEQADNTDDPGQDKTRAVKDDQPALEFRYSGPDMAGLLKPAPPAGPKEPAVHKAEVQKEELPIFEAYHTVDYFASQGIKISAELLQVDKLGKQLKSFTDWLKVMKKLPQAVNGEKQPESIADPAVRRFAENSLQEREVLTEAMAEVLVKQGKMGKAREIYEKLSLHNPHKSAYFAARIEELKAV